MNFWNSGFLGIFLIFFEFLGILKDFFGFIKNSWDLLVKCTGFLRVTYPSMGSLWIFYDSADFLGDS